MREAGLKGDDVGGLYDDLAPWAATLCEAGYRDALSSGRRRRAARVDFVPGWKEAARQLGRPDVFAAACAGRKPPAAPHEPTEAPSAAAEREPISHAEFARFVQEAQDMRRERDEARAALRALGSLLSSLADGLEMGP